MIYAISIGALLAMAVAIWYFFMLPLGKERHERELELVRRKLRQREAARLGSADEQKDSSAT
jgi:hypothetical protein